MTRTAILILFAIAQVVTSQKDAPGCEARMFVLQDLEQERTVVAPDGSRSVALGVKSEGDGDGWLKVYDARRLIHTTRLINLSGGVFVKWAPDSRAFYLMWSNGGAVGGYEVRVFRVGAGTVQEVPTTRRAERDFARRYPCEARGHNTFAIEWRDGSRQLLLAEQVYPTGDCGRRLGLYGGYLVNVADGAIHRRYSDAEIKRLWPAGCPVPVYPTGFWGSDDLKKALEKRRKGGGR